MLIVWDHIILHKFLFSGNWTQRLIPMSVSYNLSKDLSLFLVLLQINREIFVESENKKDLYFLIIFSFLQIIYERNQT